jgi:hypothetical protein
MAGVANLLQKLGKKGFEIAKLKEITLSENPAFKTQNPHKLLTNNQLAIYSRQ